MVALDANRPALLVTRGSVLGVRELITVVGITRTARGLSTEVPLTAANGLEEPSVVNCDDVHTVRRDRIGRLLGYLHQEQEKALAEGLVHAFDLQV